MEVVGNACAVNGSFGSIVNETVNGAAWSGMPSPELMARMVQMVIAGLASVRAVAPAAEEKELHPVEPIPIPDVVPEPEPLAPEPVEPIVPMPMPEPDPVPEPMDVKSSSLIVRSSQPYGSSRREINELPSWGAHQSVVVSNKRRRIIPAEECLARNLPPEDIHLSPIEALPRHVCESKIAEIEARYHLSMTKQEIAKKRKIWATALSSIATKTREIEALKQEMASQPSVDKLFIWSESMRAKIRDY